MPSDALTISYIATELDEILKNGKITKINQPENDEVVIFVYTKNGTKKLVLSANANVPRCHITIADKANPVTAPSFCMLLRKHLTGGTIERVYAPDCDRIITFDINSKNEMKDDVTEKLVIELISRQANIILVSSENKILGAMKKTSLDESSKRTILTGAEYSYPSNDKIPFKDLSGIKSALDNYCGDSLSDALQTNVGGYSYQTVAYLTDNDNIKDKNKVLKNVEIINDLKNFDCYFPCVGYDGKNAKDFFATKYSSIPLDYVGYNTLNEAIDTYYSEKDNVLRIKEHGKRLNDILKHNISRTEKKLAAQKAQMNDSADLENDRLFGELITMNLYKIAPKSTEIVAENYYADPPANIKIKLDPSLSPAKNAQHYYKKYNKKKRTIENLTKQIVESESTLSMLKAMSAQLKNVSDVKELALIENDLTASGVIQKSKNAKKQKDVKAQPYEFEYQGFDIYVGRSSIENEFVTHKLGRGKDLWFHVKKAFGSHVLVKEKQSVPFPDDLYVVAAELAAYYSEERNSPKVEVDYTEVKNVKKPPNGKLGLVVYNTNYSLACTPNAHNELKK